MIWRLQFALIGAAKHLMASVIVVGLVALLVFRLWYPYPYNQIAGGVGLFMLIVAVDVVCGPLLTFVLLNPAKPVGELRRDISFVVVIQLVALSYGVYAMSEARPVFLAFEGDRFRVVSKADIDWDSQGQAELDLPKLGFTGPKLMGTRLLEPTDPDFPASIQAAMNGLHPSYRPERWVDYQGQASQVIAGARPLDVLLKIHPGFAEELGAVLSAVEVEERNIGFFPLLSYSHDDWVVLVDLTTALPLGFLPIDIWTAH